MKLWIKKPLTALHKKLDKLIKDWEASSATESSPHSFHSLSPINNADVKQYLIALKWALDNRKKESIHNIALTGPYGSGKSSILKTFQQQNVNKEYVFLEISLATFKEELLNIIENGTGDKEKEDNTEKTIRQQKNNDDILRLIELSILQQIFYHEEDSKIPDSRFKKIRSFRRKNLIWITTGVMTALLFGLNLFLPEKIEEILTIEFPNLLSSILHWVSLIIFLSSLSIIIYRSIRLAYGIKISKFKFQEAEIEIDKGINKSILNNHLDEILYFFEVTDYSVVLIEDLDRFRQAEIFTKLRELNLLINNSKKVKQSVVFIYAVRDEMFSDKDRTKFFDFIIPVIPVINSSNSNEKLASIVKDNNYQISEDLIDDISLFIDDMRLLYNIINEYHIYHQLLSKELNQDKLLAIIVYKNIYPDDFVLLSNGKGKLYHLLSERQKYISEAISAIEIQIKVNKKDIYDIENNQIKDEVELRMLYLSYYVNELDGFDNFIINGTTQSLKQIAEDKKLFDNIVSDKVTYSRYYTQYNTHYHTQISSDIIFSNIENEINSDQSYKERLKLIDSYWREQIEELKQEIQRLEKQRTTVRHLKLQEILSDKSTNLNIDTKSRQGLLLRLLLRSGYINEDYLDYISLFYEGSITKEDRSFLLNIKSQLALEYDYKLFKISNLIDKIRTVDFKEPYLLNYNLMDFLLLNRNYQTQLDGLLGQLNDSHSNGPAFIEGFLSNGTSIELFIKEVIKIWPEIWKYVDSISELTKERKEEYLKLIIANTDIDDLKKVFEHSNLLSQIAVKSDFLTIIANQERIKEVIIAFDIKFENLDFKDAPEKLIEFICKGNFFKLSIEMLEKVMQHSGKFGRANFDTANYKAILDSENEELINYIEENINSYIAYIYLNLPLNVNEPEDTLLELLNNENIKLPNLVKLIEKTESKITNLAKITSHRTDDVLFEAFKIEPIWQNLIEYFIRNKLTFSPAIVTYINNKENADVLSEEGIDTENSNPSIEIVRAFMLALINETNIDDNIYEILLPAVPEVYSFEQVENVGFEKMQLLIHSYTIINNADNFFKVKEKYPNLQLPLLEKTPQNFLEDIEEYDLDSKDVLYILQSLIFSIEDKNKVINTIQPELIIKDNDLLRSVVKLIFDHFPFDVPKLIIVSALKYSLPLEDRIKLFNMHYKEFLHEEIQDIFKNFPYPFSDIGVVYKSPVINYGNENMFLAKNLKHQEFIANYKEEKKGIRIINFKKTRY